MNSRRTATGLLVVALVGGVGSCAAERQDEETVNTAAEAGRWSPHDESLEGFLPGYVQDHAMFGNDDLQYTVKDGLVTARGAVDNEAERDELERRIRRVPAVRDVEMRGVTVRD